MRICTRIPTVVCMFLGVLVALSGVHVAYAQGSLLDELRQMVAEAEQLGPQIEAFKVKMEDLQETL